MKLKKWLFLLLSAMAIWLTPVIGYAQDTVSRGTSTVRDSGTSAVWIFANISYAGMRAQNSPSAGWRIIAFIFGFPGTLLTLLIVREGSERAYGIELPKH
jgi:hypothetical protein